MMLLDAPIIINHTMWYYSIFFYLFILEAIVGGILTIMFVKRIQHRTNEIKLVQQQHIAKIDIIRKDHSESLEKIRLEMLRREEERSRQWIESEKETLHVLNGVSNLLDLSEKIGKIDSDRIMVKLQEIQDKVEKITIIDNN